MVKGVVCLFPVYKFLIWKSQTFIRKKRNGENENTGFRREANFVVDQAGCCNQTENVEIENPRNPIDLAGSVISTALPSAKI